MWYLTKDRRLVNLSRVTVIKLSSNVIIFGLARDDSFIVTYENDEEAGQTFVQLCKSIRDSETISTPPSGETNQQ